MPNYPTHYMVNKELSTTCTKFIFRRNHLDINDFKKIDNVWFFEENFKFHGRACYFSMTVKSNNIFDMYNINTKDAKVRESKNAFGIFLRASAQELPINIRKKCGTLEFCLCCHEGKPIPLIRKKSKEKKQPYGREPIGPTDKCIEKVPSSVSWSASHPFQGGRTSPR